jgi:FkbM family methyltransferase
MLETIAHRITRRREAGGSTVATKYGALTVPMRDSFIGPILRARGVWEPGETALLEARLRPGMTFVDAGAHVGYFTLLGSAAVGRQGRVYAFEPHPRNFELLRSNVRRNRCANVRCVRAALSDVSGDLDLYQATENTGDHRAYETADECRAVLRVPALALDDYEQLRPPLDVVKVDVQGYEHYVVKGMESLLAASRDVFLSVEFWPYGIERAGWDPRDVLDYYRSLGFDLRVQDPEAPGLTPLRDRELVDECVAEKSGWGFRTLALTRGR